MFALLLAALLAVAVVFQWFTQEVYLKLWGPIGASFHREENAGVYWSVMTAETFAIVLLVIIYFS